MRRSFVVDRRRRPPRPRAAPARRRREVWMRPCDSVTGTRWTRCTPPSNFSSAVRRLAGLGRALGLDRDGDVTCSRRGRTRWRRAPRSSSRGARRSEVHPQQVAGEQRRLLAALARLDLEDRRPCRRSGRAGTSSRRSRSSSSRRRALELRRPPSANAGSSAASSRAAAEVVAELLPLAVGRRRSASARRSAG